MMKYGEAKVILRNIIGEYNLDDLQWRAVEKAISTFDKIEKGTLIELPCKVGDTVYFVWDELHVMGQHNIKHILSMEQWKIDRILFIGENEWSVRGVGEIMPDGSHDFFWCHSSKFGVWWFLTEEEARAKIKELQNG
jgi:hypothetical protein